VQIPESRVEIDQERLLTLRAAYLMDMVGNKAARSEIAQITIVAPRTALRVLIGRSRRTAGPASARTCRSHGRGLTRARCGSPMGPMKCTWRRSRSQSWRENAEARYQRLVGPSLSTKAAVVRGMTFA